MKTPASLWCLLAIVAAASPVCAQGTEFNDYTWARNLSREFGMDERAEAIFTKMASEGSDKTAQQQGRLGLAEMKQVQARQAPNFATGHQLFGEAAKIMATAVESWPDKNSRSYYEAVFSLCDLLQERGEAAMQAVADGRVDASKAPAIRDEANKDYDQGAKILNDIVVRMGRPDPEDDIQKWRVKNASWYRLCLLTFNKMSTRQDGSTERNLLGSQLTTMLEDYILENETENEEALLGALYGYLLLGQVHEDLGNFDEAIGNITSVIDQVVWEQEGNATYRLQPPIQGLVERAYYLLLKAYNKRKDYAATETHGSKMEARFKKMNLEFKKLGRAARVELAEARLRLGDMNAALSIAAEVVDAGGGDASSVLANRLVAEIIAATPDKSQFSADIIRSAAKGAFSQGVSRRDEAIGYYNILLSLLPKHADEEERAYLVADTWFDLGRAYLSLDRRLEAALAMGEGAKVSKSVTQDGLNAKLVQYWRSFLKELEAETRSPEISKLLRDCNEWIVANPVQGVVVSGGTVRFDEARKVAREANDLQRKGKLQEAADRYQEASRLFAESVQIGGPKKESALIQGARIELIVGEIRLDQKNASEGQRLLEAAKKRMKDFISFCADPANRLTDPTAVSNREAALADAYYSIARANSGLMKVSEKPDEAKEKALWQESLEYLEKYEERFASQPDFVASALAMRVAAYLQLGRVEDAVKSLDTLLPMDPDGSRTSRAALQVAQALTKPAEDAFDAVVGKVRYSDGAEWDAVTKKPEFASVHRDLRRAANYFRTWLLAGKGQDNFNGWNKVSYLFTRLGDFEEAADITRQALKRYDGSPRSDPKVIGQMRDRLLFSVAHLAKAHDLAGRSQAAAALWAEANGILDTVLKDPTAAAHPAVVRLAAEVYGGYVAMKTGVPTFFAGQGKYAEAKALWDRIEGSLKGQGLSGTPEWWEARFYSMHCTLRDRKANKQSVEDIKKALEILKVVSPEYGGRQWRPFFEWMERETF